jgi:hypothetical protein
VSSLDTSADEEEKEETEKLGKVSALVHVLYKLTIERTLRMCAFQTNQRKEMWRMRGCRTPKAHKKKSQKSLP